MKARLTYGGLDLSRHVSGGTMPEPGMTVRDAELDQALRIATNALRWYASEKNWKEDDWGCVAVVDHPDYGNGGQKARNALKRLSRYWPSGRDDA
jgi:type II secretory pathway pseudopilin PulG